jgi:large subunit ribosomal protein L4e
LIPSTLRFEMAARPLVNVYDAVTGEVSGQAELPAVFTAPIRSDVVSTVHRDLNMNRRQPYAVNKDAGMQHSAESWGTGRAVSRIPRISGSGTHRAGQAAFGNMCRQGRMFAPTKTWRKWHRKVSVNQRRFATTSALAASAVPALVMARGHRVEALEEVPLVLSNTGDVSKTRVAVEILERFGAYADVQRVKDSRRKRAGKGKARNRRYVQRRGPLLVTATGEEALARAFRNIQGVDIANVERLNLLQLAPGGHVGRFIIWSAEAFNRLPALYGSATEESTEKAGYKLPTAMLGNADIGRIINSQAVQAVLRPGVKATKYITHKKNPLKNLGAMVKLNPYAMTVKRSEMLAAKARAEGRSKDRKARRNTRTDKGRREGSKAFYAAMMSEE